MSELSLSQLGSFAASLDGKSLLPFRAKSVQALLIYLVCEAERAHQREALMDLLWPGMPLASAQTNMRQTLYRLRQAIPEVRGREAGTTVPFVVANRSTIQINPEAVYEVDVQQFTDLIERDPERAITLYRGDFLADFYLPDSETFEEWVNGRRAHHQRQILTALDEVTAVHLQNGRYDAAEKLARQQLTIDNLLESGHRQLMEALVGNGRRRAALSHYESLSQLLQTELDIEPSPETQALVKAIRAGELSGKIVERQEEREEKGKEHSPLPTSSPPHNLSLPPNSLIERELPSGIITFLFTDIQGSTPLWEQDPSGMRASLEQHHAILHEAITANGGQVFKIIGDAFQAAFVDPAAALAAALAGQRRLAAAAWGRTGPLQVRMGVHLGHAKTEGDDYVTSHTLNRVARLMAAGHGGQILLSSEVVDIVRRELPQQVTLSDLGHHRLKGMWEPEHIYQLVVSDLPNEFPPLQSLPLFASNLPTQPTPFIGRAQELAELAALLGQANGRLITIVGPGGMGKTRLALAVAEKIISSFSHGVYFINLAPLNEPVQIVSAVAEALNFPLQGASLPGASLPEGDGRSPQQQLLDYLRQKKLLLVLDNFEHLLAGASLVNEILQTAPEVKIITTSRERLHLQQEQVYPIGGLEFPDWETPEDAAEYTAVELFLQSAKRNQPDFALRNDNDLTYLARICRTVAGMPLALELAASWVDMMPLAEIAAELQQGLDLLETDMQDMPERHRSVRSAIDYSWQKLAEKERDIFAKLSVFRGGFTREAAQAVAEANLRQLARLVNKSLVQGGGQDGRYQLHELLRQYAGEKLVESGQKTAVRNQHSRYYCQTLGEKEAQAGKDQQLARAEIEADLGNLEAAWHWAVQHRLWSHLHQAGYSLYWFYISRLRFQDGLALFQWTVDQLAPDNLAEVEDKDTAWILARVLIWLAEFYSILNQMRRAETLLQQSQALIQSQILAQADIQRDEALWFFTKARVVFPKTEDALGFAQKSLLLARASGDQWQEVQTLRLLGVVFSDQSDVEMAQKSFNNALTLLRSLNDLHLMTMLLLDMGILARNQMDYQHSETLFKESLTLARSQNDQQAIAVALAYLGFLKLFLGEFESGAEYLQQSVELHRKNGDLGNTASNMANLANAYTFAGHLPQARQCIAESLAIAAAFPNILQFVFTTQARINVWMGQYKAAHNNINRLFSVIDETSESRELWFTNSYGPAGWLALVQSDLVIAKENLQKLVDFNRQFNSSESQEWTAIHQATLSRAEWGLGQQATARQHLLEALAVAVKIRAFVTLLHVLPIVPVFLAGEEDTRHKVRAIKIYALANSHPFIANCQFFYDIAGKDVEAVEAELPADVVTAAKARGQALDFWPTAESLLAELTELGWGEEAQRSGGAGEQGRFVKEELVATGGFGEVYRGRDTETGRVVVIKRLRAELVAQQPEALARFEREGELLRQLNHPNIVQMIASEKIEGKPCLIMEYVAGGSLRDLLDRDGRLSVAQTLDIALELADALSRAHHLGIIHRDLKPGNVLLAEDGTPRLTDFGIARMTQQEAATYLSRQLTQAGALLGTVEYMSPEACRGEELDGRADIWSFGVLLYEMLTGERPFSGEQITSTIIAILNNPVPDLRTLRPDVPAALMQLIEQMLVKDKEERLSLGAGASGRMRQVAAELDRIRAHL